jgi:tetratricopeptide (TPR) repeat protein
MKRILTILLLISSILSMSIASSEVDSLLNLLPESNDHEKVDILLKLSDQYSISTLARIEYGERAAEIATRINYLEGKAFALNSLGVEFDFLSDHEKAMEYYLESLAVFESINDSSMSTVLNNIGSLYGDLGDQEKSFEYYRISRKYINDKDSSSIATYYNNVANVYGEIGVQDSSLIYFELAGQIYEKLKDEDGIAMILNNIADVDNYLGNYTSALESGVKSKELYEKIGDQEGVVYALMTIGETYILMKDYPNALKYLGLAMEIVKPLKSLELESFIYKGLYTTYYDMGTYEKAFNYYGQYTVLKDSVFSLESVNEINRMNVLFETEKKAKEIIILKKEAQVRTTLQNGLILGLISIFVVAFILYRNNLLRKRLNTTLQDQNDEISIKNEELIELNNQLKNAMDEVKSLSGMLPICSNCKKIRDDKGYWNQVEVFIKDHSEAQFSHGICPDCTKLLYSEYPDSPKSL